MIPAWVYITSCAILALIPAACIAIIEMYKRRWKEAAETIILFRNTYDVMAEVIREWPANHPLHPQAMEIYAEWCRLVDYMDAAERR